MRILIVSDTHGKNGNLEKVLRLTAPLDLMFHLGDLEGSEGYIESITPCEAHMVSGNNDFLHRYLQKKLWAWDIIKYLCPTDTGMASASIHCVLKKLPESMGAILRFLDTPIGRSLI